MLFFSCDKLGEVPILFSCFYACAQRSGIAEGGINLIKDSSLGKAAFCNTMLCAGLEEVKLYEAQINAIGICSERLIY